MSFQWRETLKDATPTMTGVGSALLGLGTMRLSAILESYVLLFLSFALLIGAVYMLFMWGRDQPQRWPVQH
jgi:hypothetical protein